MSEAFVKIDLHGLRQEEAMKVIDKALASAGSTTYQLQLIHGYNRGTSLRSMIHDWYQYEPKVKRIMICINEAVMYYGQRRRRMDHERPRLG